MTKLAVTDPEQSGDNRDRGAILLLVLAVAIVFSLIVLALANFVAADLRYSQVIDARAKTLSSAESGIDYAVDRLRLNQTLCATDAAASGPVSLNGTGPVGTALPQALNWTDTKVTCERLDDDIADVAGWAVVIADDATPLPSDMIRVDMNGTTVSINGPVFLPDATRTATDSNSRVEIVGGDLWYTRASCGSPYSSTYLAGRGLDVTPSAARGGICTTRVSGDAFSGPPPPGAPGADNPPYTVDASLCRVFSPGRYNTALSLGPNNYFMSGEYHVAGTGILVNAAVWAGGPDPADPTPPQTANAPCVDARNADTLNGPGATFYFDAGSTLTLSSGSTFEIFGRRQGNHLVSVQALYAGIGDPALVTTQPGGSVDVVMHGLVWAPYNRVVLENSGVASEHRFLGGMVVGRLHVVDVRVAGFEIRPATSMGDTSILLRSTSTIEHGATTVEAVVEYRPHAADLDDRVAVSSFRVVD